MSNSNPPTAREIRDIIAESAERQLASLEEQLSAIGVDIPALARAIGGGASMLIAMRISGE